MDSSVILAVKVADQTYGIPIEKVELLLDCSGIRPPLMTVPAWFAGVIELRDEVVPVVDLCALLRRRRHPPATPTLVIVRATNRPMGIVVDAASGIHAPQGGIPILDIDSTLACGDMAPVRKALGHSTNAASHP